VNSSEARTDRVVGVHPPVSLSGSSSVTSPATISRRVGLSDLRVFPIALSGTAFGWTADGPTTTAILDRFVELEGSIIDTADSYAGGRSEIMIGQWMRSRGNRDALTISTKVGKSADHPGLGAPAIRAAVEASMRRLRVDHIDLLFLHVDDRSVSFDETLLAVDELIRAGHVRYFGGSDHTGERLLEARIAAGQLDVAHMVALQKHYNLVHRHEYEGDLARVATQLGLAVFPRYALAGGFLAGAYRGRADLPREKPAAEASQYVNRRGLKVLAALDRVAAEMNTQVATAALAWLLSRPRVVAPVVSVTAPKQLDALMAAPRTPVGRHLLTELDRASGG
jgi:aryl-alcohol dehydrogenase-like predicted oxidoreductase